MKKTTTLRIVGGVVLMFNLWAIGNYNISGFPVLLMTIGFAIVYELVVVRLASKNSADEP